MVKGVAHLCFVVRDLDESITFYSKKLGLKQAFDFINERGERFGIYLHAGQRTFIELFKGEPQALDEKQSYRHLCLEVDDLEATIKQLRLAEVKVTDAKMGSDHSWQAWLADPSGNRIELHQYTAESKQAPFAK